MGERPLIVPFQIETYVTNNKNTPDKNCAQISPDYTKAEYTSYLGGKLEPAPFTAPCRDVSDVQCRRKTKKAAPGIMRTLRTGGQ